MIVSPGSYRASQLVFSRVAALAAALCFGAGCAVHQGAAGEPARTRVTPAAQVSSAAPMLAPARELLPAGESEIGLTFHGGEAISELVLDTGAAAPRYEVSRLESPARLVIDVAGLSAPGNGSFIIDDSTLVEGVRVGAHPDKTRVVLDLAESAAVENSVQVDGGRIILTLRDGTGASPVRAALPAVDPSAVAPSAVAPLAASSASPRHELTALRLESAGHDGNLLIADVSRGSTFEFKRTAPSEYVLRMEGADLNDTSVQTIVAPASSGQIRSVRPLVEGDAVALRIFASPLSDLQAERRGDQIIVRDSSGLPLVAEDIRAQAKPDAAAPAELAAAPAVPVAAEPPVSPEAAKPEAAKAEAAAPAAEASAADEVVDPEVAALLDEQPIYSGRLISLDLQDTDIDNALRIIAEVSNLNIIASQDVAGKVTLRLIDVPWDQALDVILKTNGLDKVQEGNVVRIAPVDKLRAEREALKQAQQAEEELEPLGVRYLRVSYAKAAELKPLIDTVISERGSVSYDERTNQLIVKDIRKGLKNVAELVSKLDLRTPQILIETQIVEAKRDFSRELGAELGFQHIQSPSTGNATGMNFPNTINIIGDAGTGAPGTLSSFPAAAGSGISFLLGSADGTMTLNTRLSALESEGRGRVVSRPSVATTNNKQAVIKSVEKIRIKTPSGGLSVATGAGASAQGTSAVATEVIEVGIVLEVTPQASPDYYVLLDINAKSSTLGPNRVDGIPGEIERSATSTVLVSSGQTFAMGGIYKIDDVTSIEGVPFFKDIPFIGHFFRRSVTDNGDEELLFFLTPRIVEGSFDDSAMKASS